MIQFTSITKNATGSWTFTWTATPGVTYNVILWGRQIAQVTSDSYTWSGQEYGSFPPPLEVVPLGQQAFSQMYPSFTVLQWYGEPDAQQYLVQQSPDGSSAWTTIFRQQEIGQWIYSFTTTTLIDEETYYYQVIAVNSLGTQSNARKFTKYVITNPTPPDGELTYTWDNPNLVISTAS